MFEIPTLNFDSIGLDSIYIDSQLTADYLPAPNVACWILVLVLLARFLKVFSYTESPVVTLNENAATKSKLNGQISLKEVLAACPILQER